MEEYDILSFEKPKKVKSTKEHNEMYSSSVEAAGSYVPNMSEEDMKKWKAKHIIGDDERIEIRKTLGGVQVLIVVYKKPQEIEYPEWSNTNYKYKDAKYEELLKKYKEDMKKWAQNHKNIRISMNGNLDMTVNDFWDLNEAIKQAMEILL